MVHVFVSEPLTVPPCAVTATKTALPLEASGSSLGHPAGGLPHAPRTVKPAALKAATAELTVSPAAVGALVRYVWLSMSVALLPRLL